jgi:putative DNA primase/helicase
MTASTGAMLLELGITVRAEGPIEQRVSCPRCQKSPKDEALGVNIRTGLFHCYRCGWSGRIGSTDRSNRQRVEKSGEKHQGLSPWGREFWDRCLPLAGTALAYLKARGCIIPPDDGDLRYCVSLLHRPSGYAGPALVALVTDAITREPLTVHRTWVRADGTRPDIKPQKMLLRGHRKRNGVIRLFKDVTRGLALAEGVESALSAAHAFTPVWSAIDAGNLEGLPLLGGIESLTIFADNDTVGLKAAQALGQRWADAGREVCITVPVEAGADINDVVVG